MGIIINKVVKLCLSLTLALTITSTQADTFSVGVEVLDYSPFYSGKGRAYNGMSREILDAYSSDKGHSFSYAPTKIEKLYDNYFTGVVDFKFPDNPNWKADKKKGKDIIYSSPVIITKVGVIVLKGNEAATLKKVGTVTGFTPWSLLGDIKAGKLKLVKATAMRKLLKMLSTGKIDGIYGSIDVVNFHSKKLGKEFKFSNKYTPSEDKFHFSSFSKKNVIKDFNAWLEANKSKVQSIKDKYLK